MPNLRDYDRDATLIEKVRGLERQLADAQAVIEHLRGAMQADDDRLYEAGKRVGLAMLAATPSVPESCKWALTEPTDDGMWESACGAAWTFIDGGPTENNMRFCLACGRVLEVVTPKPEDGKE